MSYSFSRKYKLFFFCHHAQLFSTDTLSIPDNAPTSGIDTVFSQRSSLSSYTETGHLFSRPISQNPSVLLSDSHLLNIDLTTDQYSTPPTPNRVDYRLIVNDTLINSPCKIVDSYILPPINLIQMLMIQMNVAV